MGALAIVFGKGIVCWLPPFLGNFNFRFVFLILKLALRPPMANNPERQKV